MLNAKMLNAKLVVVGGDAKAKEVTLKLPTIIGRGKDVTLTLPHALVSRKHVEIFEKDGWLFVRDLGSLNGTYVNSRQIKEAQRLPPNHLLTLGNVTFRAVYQAPVLDISADTENATERKEDETINFEELAESPKDSGENSTCETAAAPELKEDSQPIEKSPASEAASEKPAAGSVDQLDDFSVLPEVARLSEGAPAESSIDSSSIFSGDEEFMSPEKSISVSALEALPCQATPASMSLINNQLKGLGAEKPSVDSIDLDVADNANAAVQSNPDLGSFLKKLPR